MRKSIEEGKLRDLHIDRDDIIATYDNGPERAAVYEKIRALLGQHASIADIIKQFPDANPDTIRLKAKEIRDNDRKPKCIKGTDRLEQLGLLPMNIDNSLLLLLNLLISANFWRGCRSDSSKTSNYSAISIQNSTQEKLMGYGTGRKKNGALTAPAYIQAALSSLKAINTLQKERIIALEILRDYILTLLFFRYHVNGYVRRALLLTMPDDSAGKEHALLTAKIANIALNPALHFGSQNQSDIDQNGVLTVKTKVNEQKISEAYQKRVREVIEQTRAACGESHLTNSEEIG